jgi:hypothetical protein
VSVKPEQLYLDLMKKTLSFSLWPEPLVPIEVYNFMRTGPRRALVSAAVRALRNTNIRLAFTQNVKEEERAEGNVWPGYAHTMIGRKRLDNIQYCIETVLNDGIPGDLIETGVWRGGATIFMRAVLAAYGVEDRKVFVADSFAGLPEPDATHPADAGDRHHTFTYLAVSRAEVENNFRHYGLLDDQVVFLQGWFKDTLPAAPIEKLAVLRLDGDMYSSTMDVLHTLYAKLAPGGYCIIDDYHLQGCRTAVDEFRTERGIKAPLQTIDFAGRYWRKEG